MVMDPEVPNREPTEEQALAASLLIDQPQHFLLLVDMLLSEESPESATQFFRDELLAKFTSQSDGSDQGSQGSQGSQGGVADFLDALEKTAYYLAPHVKEYFRIQEMAEREMPDTEDTPVA